MTTTISDLGVPVYSGKPLDRARSLYDQLAGVCFCSIAHTSASVRLLSWSLRRMLVMWTSTVCGLICRPSAMVWLLWPQVRRNSTASSRSVNGARGWEAWRRNRRRPGISLNQPPPPATVRMAVAHTANGSSLEIMPVTPPCFATKIADRAFVPYLGPTTAAAGGWRGNCGPVQPAVLAIANRAGGG